MCCPDRQESSFPNRLKVPVFVCNRVLWGVRLQSRLCRVELSLRVFVRVVRVWGGELCGAPAKVWRL